MEIEDLEEITKKIEVRSTRSSVQPATARSKFLESLKKTDSVLCERLFELAHIFNKLGIDERPLAQLQTCFKGTMTQVPVQEFTEAATGVFRHYPSLKDVLDKILECV